MAGVHRYGLASARTGVFHLAEYRDSAPWARCDYRLFLGVVDVLERMERSKPPLRFCKRCARYDTTDPWIEVFFA